MEPEGTILFSTVGIPQFGFDIFSLPLHSDRSQISTQSAELRHTDGVSVNFNAGFAGDSSDSVVFVSERTGSARLFLSRSGDSPPEPLPTVDCSLFHDRPTVKNGRLYFVSAHEKSSEPFKSWAAVYETDLSKPEPVPVRLTPPGTVDLSPAVSQSGKYMAVASHGSGKWKGDFRELETEIVVFPISNPSKRKAVISNGGWPAWQGDSAIFYHRQAKDGWWSLFRSDVTFSGDDVSVSGDRRITPPGVHAFTPAASHAGKVIAVATRRKGKPYRHIELFDLEKEKFYPVTEILNPVFHHYNPFFSAQSDRLGYHRFRGESAQGDSIVPYLHPVTHPVKNNLEMLRVYGTFPSFSPDGEFIAINGDFLTTPGLWVLRSDGSKRWTLIEQSGVFYTCWSPTEKGVIFTSMGPIFESAKVTVQIARVSFNMSDLVDNDAKSTAQIEDGKVTASVKILTSTDKGNNAFPSCSPDGKRLVFRSGRSGFKNLYIVDAIHGEEGGELFRLTEGDWIDTMPSWSPDGQWIAFSSNQHDPNDPTGFGLYMVRPDGTKLHRVPVAGPEGSDDLARERINHVCFSPDSKWLLFTANFGAIMAEPVSGPNQFQPYGDLYACRLDGSGLVRLTCNGYENGTPAWHNGARGLQSLSLGEPNGEKLRGWFDEPLWISCDI